MNINDTNKINFNGGFRFVNMSAENRAKLPQLINKGKAIFDDFGKQGDVFLVTRETHDEKVLQFIKENKLNFEFYPSINTNLMVQNQPLKLKKILDDIKDSPAKKITEAREAIKNRTIKNIQEKSPEHVTNILRELCIDNKYPIVKAQGFEKIIDKELERTIYISKPSKFGMRYVKIMPNNKNKESSRYMMDDSGYIHAKFNTPDAIRTFETRFIELIKK